MQVQFDKKLKIPCEGIHCRSIQGKEGEYFHGKHL